MLVHAGGQKGSGHAEQAAQVASGHRGQVGGAQAGGVPGWVRPRPAATARGIEPDAAEALVEAVGPDLRALAAAADQLTTTSRVSRSPPSWCGSTSRARRREGLRDRRPRVGRPPATALEELRWALDTGSAPCWSPAAFAGSVRGLARYKGAARGLRDADLAREVGVPPWKLRTLRDQARGWDDDGLARPSGRSPGPTPTSRAQAPTRRTRWSGWSSPSPAAPR